MTDHSIRPLRSTTINVHVDEHNRISVKPKKAKATLDSSEIAGIEPVRLVFKLSRPAGSHWKFRHYHNEQKGYFYGIIIEDAPHGEFVDAERISDTEVQLTDKNDSENEYKYTVVLTEDIEEDPTIENRAGPR